jgi:hypothetical protein
MSSWRRSNRSPRDYSPPKTGRRIRHSSVRDIVSGLPPARDGGEQPSSAIEAGAPEHGEALSEPTSAFSPRHTSRTQRSTPTPADWRAIWHTRRDGDSVADEQAHCWGRPLRADGELLVGSVWRSVHQHRKFTSRQRPPRRAARSRDATREHCAGNTCTDLWQLCHDRSSSSQNGRVPS